MNRGLRGKVKLLLIDDTRVKVGGREVVLFIAFESNLRRIVYMHEVLRGYKHTYRANVHEES